jgi:hypothetical protein
MNDMRSVIEPRSDQLNADSLLAGPINITITKVEIRPGTEQPVSIFYAGDEGKPWKCCKSMARVLVSLWGPDANAYIGRSLQLYCDPKVTWGGMAVGGIRIAAMSDIAEAHTMALTATKGSRKPFTVRPMAKVQPKTVPGLRAEAEAAAANGVAAYRAFWNLISRAQREFLMPHHEALKAAANAAMPHNPDTGEVHDDFGLPPVNDAAAPPDSPSGGASTTGSPQERQQPARDEAFFAKLSYRITVPMKNGREDWQNWADMMRRAVGDCANLDEIIKLQEDNQDLRNGLLEANAKARSNLDASFAAAEKRL